MNVYWIAAAWMGMALLASLISIRVGVSVALVEIVVGAVLGNLPGHTDLFNRPSSRTSWPPWDRPYSPSWPARR